VEGRIGRVREENGNYPPTSLSNGVRCLHFDGHSKVLKWFNIFREGVHDVQKEDNQEIPISS
jgi:hypothetical protein